jgi:hypothetical protein
METRLATFNDIPKIVDLWEEAHREFGNESVSFCRDTSRNTLQRVVNQREHAAFLLVGKDKVIYGVLVGLVNQLFYSRGRCAQDLIYYVKPDTRGHGAKLLAAFLAWAHNVKGVVEIQIGITSGAHNVERIEGLLKASGMKKVGGIYTLHPAEEIDQCLAS